MVKRIKAWYERQMFKLINQIAGVILGEMAKVTTHPVSASEELDSELQGNFMADMHVNGQSMDGLQAFGVKRRG